MYETAKATTATRGWEEKSGKGERGKRERRERRRERAYHQIRVCSNRLTMKALHRGCLLWLLSPHTNVFDCCTCVHELHMWNVSIHI